MPLNKQQLEVVNQTNFPDNNSKLITPALLRDFNTDMIDAIQLTGSYATTGSNAFVGNQTITGNLSVSGVISASVLYVQTETASVIYSSGSNQLGDELTDIQTLSGSVKIQGQLLINGIPLTSGSTTDTGSLVTTASFNAYTQSTNLRLNSLETNSASVNVSISNLNQATASLNTSVTALNQFTQSQAALNGTFATTGSNTFTGNQIIDRASKLYTNGIYWTDVTAGFNNLEIINQGGGNLDFASLNGGKIRFVSSSVNFLNSPISSSNDISTSANIYAANLTGSATIPAGTISSSAQITALGFVSSSITASSLITASFDNNTRNLTFTKGNNTTFAVNIPDVSGSAGNFVTTSSFNAYTQSNDQRVSSLETNSASVNTSISNINNTTASLLIETQNLELFSASALTSISNLNTATASLFTSTSLSLITASFSGNTLTFTKGDASTFGVVIPDVSGSTINTGSFVTTSSFNAYTSSNDQKVNNLISATGSYVTSAITASSLVTASVNLNTITFTKGDGTTFPITVNTGSGGGTIDTGSFATTGSNNFFGNQQISGAVRIGETFGTDYVYIDNGGVSLYNDTQTSINFNSPTNFFQTTGNFSLQNQIGGVGSGSMSMTAYGGGNLILSGSELRLSGVDFIPFSASVNSRILASTINTGSFATTGSNTFTADQNISGSINFPNGTFLVANVGQQSVLNSPTSSLRIASGVNTSFYAGSTLEISGAAQVNIIGQNDMLLQASNNMSLTGSQLKLQGFTYPTNDGTNGQVLTTNGNKILSFTTVATGSGGGTAFSNPNLVSNSGSLFIVANTFSSSSLGHISASAQNQSNLVFKNNENIGDTILSGSNNIFTNPATPTTGYTRYIGGANNIYLNSTNGINSQITASAASVSGVRPAMNNNIFNGTGNFTINQAPNPGTHTYSQNIIGGTSNTTINALGFTGSLGFSSNIIGNGTITINAASASVAEIATGISGSGTLNIDQNYVNGGTITISTPRIAGYAGQAANNNILAGGTLTTTNISSSAAVNSNQNIIIGTMSYTNAGASGLGLHTSNGVMNTNYGAMTLIASASAISATNNISPTAMTVTNRYYSGGTLGSGSLTIANNQIQGGSNTYTITGSYGGTGFPAMAASAIFGVSNTIFTNVEGRGNYTDFRSNLVGGTNLILTGSNNNTITANGGAYFGRFNADDGIRNGTGENIFVVGTGNSTTRKTGFLIDSGSNTFIEGTLNVSGSTTMTGSVSISGSTTIRNGNLIFSGSAGGDALKIQAINSTNLEFSSSGYLIFGANGLGIVQNDRNSNFTMRADMSLGATFGAYASQSANMVVGVYDPDGTAYDNELKIFANPTTGITFTDIDNTTYNYIPWLKTIPNDGSNPAPIFTRGLSVSGSTSLTGSLSIAPTFQAKFATGSNQQAGTAVLDGANPGTVTVSNSLVTANSIIMLTKQTLNHTNGYVAVSAKSAGSFTITSNHNGDTDTVGWFIINNS